METVKNYLISQSYIFTKMLDSLALYQHVSKNGSISSNSMLSNYLVRGLLKSGASSNNNYIAALKKWYLESSKQTSEIDIFLVEGLIMLGLEDDSEYIESMLKELLSKRYTKGRFELPTGYIIQSDLFATMITLRAFLYLKKKERVPEKIYKEIISWILSHSNEIKAPKDKMFPVFLMSLYSFDDYKSEIENLFLGSLDDLTTLIAKYESNVDSQNQNEIIRDVETILWLTYNLIPIKNKFAQATSIVEKLIQIIHKVIFYFEETNQINKAVSDEIIYFNTRFYSLVLTVFSDYYGKVFDNIFRDELILKNCTIEIDKFYKNQYNQLQPFIHTIKEWITTEITNIEQLSGGYSGSKIVRLYSKLVIPINNQEVKLPNLICKISEEDNFEKELQNYKSIPKALKYRFSKSSDTFTYRNESVFLVMEDLTDFHTLLEIINSESIVGENYEEIYHQLFHVLKSSYIYEPKKQDGVALFTLYYDDIVRSIGAISKNDFDDKNELISKLNIIQSEIFNSLSTMNNIPCTIMHGDLNLRNVMIKSSNEEFQIKFIDLDNYSTFGDYVYDLGELYIDTITNLEDEKVHKVFMDFSVSLSQLLKDEFFKERLRISMFRSFIKLSKINFNRGRIVEGIELLKASLTQYESYETKES